MPYNPAAIEVAINVGISGISLINNIMNATIPAIVQNDNLLINGGL